MGFIYKNFEVTGHAFDRFNQRTGMIPFELMEFLGNATLYQPSKGSPEWFKRYFGSASGEGLYMLESQGVIFVVNPNQGDKHRVITTLINPDMAEGDQR